MDRCKVSLNAVKSNQFKIKCNSCPDELERGMCIDVTLSEKNARQVRLGIYWGEGRSRAIIMQKLTEIKGQQKIIVSDFNKTFKELLKEMGESK